MNTCYISSSVLSIADNVMNTVDPTFQDSCGHLLYIDDAVLYSTSYAQLCELDKRVEQAYAPFFPVNLSKRIRPTNAQSVITVLGIDIDGSSGVMSVSSERLQTVSGGYYQCSSVRPCVRFGFSATDRPLDVGDACTAVRLFPYFDMYIASFLLLAHAYITCGPVLLKN